MITPKKISIIVFFVLLIISAALFYISHKTSIKYNDWAVLGHTFQEVEEKYGDFDLDYDRKKAYCLEKIDAKGNLPYNPEYYWMVSDESGIIKDVYVAGKPGG